jgi:hypothetical protein
MPGGKQTARHQWLVAMGLLCGSVLGLFLVGWVVIARDCTARQTRWAAQQLALTHMASESDGVTRALDAYRIRHGAYPTKLDALVPSLLLRVERPPDPKAGAWEYETGDGGRWCELSARLPGRYYPFGRSLWCTLVWRSDRTYPREGYGGKLVWRTGDWAFYNE